MSTEQTEAAEGRELHPHEARTLRAAHLRIDIAEQALRATQQRTQEALREAERRCQEIVGRAQQRVEEAQRHLRDLEAMATHGDPRLAVNLEAGCVEVKP